MYINGSGMGTMCSALSRRSVKSGQNTVSARICWRARTISSRLPFKVWCVVTYNKFYNEIIHKGIIKHITNTVEYGNDWATIVGSYVEKTCVNSSDVDFMRTVGIVFVDPDDIPKDIATGLVVITVTDASIMPPGSCWLRLHNTTRFDRYSNPSRVRNGLEWFLNCGDKIKRPNFVCRSKTIDGHTHVPYKSVFDKLICLIPACVANKDGYKYFSRKMMEDYFSTSGLTVWNYFNKLLPNWLNHGPAFQQTYFGCFDVDVVNSFHCPKGWPDSAEEWITRPRKWPHRDLVSEIVQLGFHVVPIASRVPGTEDPDLEWRISFRDAETKLVLSFNECQRLCYVTLKIVAKEYIQPKFPGEDFMSSYIMKTLMFWTMEETDAGLWENSNMVECLSVCLVKLKAWLEVGVCPNYFIQDYNLFRTKIQRMFVLGYREWLISEIDRDGWKILLMCKSFEHLRNMCD